METDGGGETGISSDWAELTQECLINILSRLDLADRWRGPMLVCKSWSRACQDPSLFPEFDLETLFESATEMSSWWTREFERKIDSMLRSVADWSYGSLTEIRVRHCSDHSLSFVAERYVDVSLKLLFMVYFTLIIVRVVCRSMCLHIMFVVSMGLDVLTCEGKFE